MKLDNYYRFVFSTFGFAYFVGLIVGLAFAFTGHMFLESTDYTKMFYMSNNLAFNDSFTEITNTSTEAMVIPFAYLAVAVKYGYTHAFLLTNSLLGQINLLTQLLPLLFYFISIIIFSAIGLKIIIYIVTYIVNKILEKYNKVALNIKIFGESDIFLLYIGIVAVVAGALIQTYLTKMFFIFMINLGVTSYIFIIIFYILMIFVSFFVTYKTTNSLLNNLNNISKYMISK